MNLYKIKKVTLWLTLPIVVLYILALQIGSWYINHNEQRFVGIIENEFRKVNQGDFSIGTIKASAWKSFPYLRVGIYGITLKDSVYHRPILRMDDVHVGVSLLGFLMKKVNISSLTIDGGTFDLFTDAKGYSNAYLLQFKKKNSSDKQQKSKLNFDFYNKNIYLKNFQISLQEKDKHKRFAIAVHRIKTSFDKNKEKFKIQLDQDILINGLGFKLSNGSFLKNMPMVVDWNNMQFDPTKQILSFEKSKVYFRDTLYNIGGWFNFSGDSATSHMHLEVAAPNTTFNHASSILSENIERKLATFGWKGPIAVTATLDGSLHQSTPSIQVQAIAKNSTLVLPDKTAEIDSCSFIGHYNNQQIKPREEPDDTNSVIHLDKFVGRLNGAEIKGSMIQVRDLIHPYLSVHLSSNAQLASLDRSLDFQTIRFTGGQSVLALNYDGPVIDNLHAIENMSGYLVLKDAAGTYIPNNFPFHGCSGTVVFNRQFLKIKGLQFFINQNHFQINLNGIRAREDTALFGIPEVDCDVKTSGININNFIAIFGNKSDSSATQRNSNMKTSISKETLPIDDIMKRGKLRIHLFADKVEYNNFRGYKVETNMLFHDNYWKIDSLKLRHADGTIALKAMVKKHPTYNDVDLDLKMNQIDIHKTFYAFDNFGISPIGFQNLKGKLSVNGKLNTRIDTSGAIVHRSTNGHVDFELVKGVLLHFQPVMNLKQYFFKNRDLSNIEFAPIHSAFDLHNGIIYLHPIYIRSTFLDLAAEGIYSPYGNTDMALKIPFRSLKTDTTGNKKVLPQNDLPFKESTLNLSVLGKNKNDIKISLEKFSFSTNNKKGKDYWALFNYYKNLKYK